jgi:hypothetical protein
LIRFLFTHTAGLSILAGAGLLAVCVGVSSFFGSPETQPTTLTLADLEGRPALPRQQWLRLSEGCRIWPEARQLVTTLKKRGSGEVTDVKTKTVYVPFVSKAVLGAWQQQGANTPFPRNKVRAFVKLEPGALEKDFPQGAAEPLKVQPQVSGLAGSLQDEDKVVREGLTEGASGMNPQAVVVLRYGEQPPTKGAMVGAGIVMVLLGLGLAVPLVLRLTRGQRAAQASSAGLQGAAMAGFEAGLRDAVRGAVAQGVAAGSAGAPPVPRLVQFYYVQNGQRFGPVALNDLRGLWAAGKLRPEHLVWQEGTKDWVPAASVQSLFH